MSYPPVPLPYATPMGNPRPTSVTVLAIIGIILGALGLLGGLCGLLPYVTSMPGKNPIVDMIKDRPVLYAWTVVSTVIHWGLAIVLLSSSIGALLLRPWARRGMVLYAVCSLILTVLGLIMFLALMVPMMSQLMSNSDPALRMGAIGGMVGEAVGILIGPIYPIFILVFMRRPHVLAAFGQAGPAEPAGPGQFPGM